MVFACSSAMGVAFGLSISLLFKRVPWNVPHRCGSSLRLLKAIKHLLSFCVIFGHTNKNGKLYTDSNNSTVICPCWRWGRIGWLLLAEPSNQHLHIIWFCFDCMINVSIMCYFNILAYWRSQATTFLAVVGIVPHSLCSLSKFQTDLEDRWFDLEDDMAIVGSFPCYSYMHPTKDNLWLLFVVDGIKKEVLHVLFRCLSHLIPHACFEAWNKSKAKVLHQEILKPVVLLLGCNYACSSPFFVLSSPAPLRLWIRWIELFLFIFFFATGNSWLYAAFPFRRVLSSPFRMLCVLSFNYCLIHALGTQNGGVIGAAKGSWFSAVCLLS